MKKQISMNNNKYDAFVDGKKIDNFFLTVPEWLYHLDQTDLDDIHSLKIVSTLYACSGCNVLTSFLVYIDHTDRFCIDNEWFYDVNDYVLCFWQDEIELKKNN